MSNAQNPAAAALKALIERLADSAELYGSDAWMRAERRVREITEADRLIVLATEPQVIGEVLRDEDNLERFEREVWMALRYGADADAQRAEIGAAVRRLIWARIDEELLYLVRAELDRREQAREAEADPVDLRTAAARAAGVPAAGEIP